MSQLSGIKDVDREILNKLDDKDLLIACSIDKYTWKNVCDDAFLKRRLLAKYPKIEQFKKENESWKAFFLRVITYISLMREKFRRYKNYDYIELFKDYKTNINLILNETSKLGELNYVKWSLKEGADIHSGLEAPLMYAIDGGQLEIVKYLAEHGADIHAGNDHALIEASRNRHLEIVKYLVEHGANIHAYDNEALKYAKYYGHSEIEEYLNSKRKRYFYFF